MINRVTEHKHDKLLEAYIERRNRLWAQVVRDNPTYSEVDVIARLEQFGA